LEGLTRPGIPIIEVQDPEGKPLKTAAENLAAIVNAGHDTPGRTCFHPDDIDAIGMFMEAYHEK
jgi:hypothetical protein